MVKGNSSKRIKGIEIRLMSILKFFKTRITLDHLDHPDLVIKKSLPGAQTRSIDATRDFELIGTPRPPNASAC